MNALCAGRGAASGKTCSGSLLGADDANDTQMINSTHVKAYRSAAGGKRMGRAPVGKWFLQVVLTEGPTILGVKIAIARYSKVVP